MSRSSGTEVVEGKVKILRCAGILVPCSYWHYICTLLTLRSVLVLYMSFAGTRLVRNWESAGTGPVLHRYWHLRCSGVYWHRAGVVIGGTLML